MSNIVDNDAYLPTRGGISDVGQLQTRQRVPPLQAHAQAADEIPRYDRGPLLGAATGHRPHGESDKDADHSKSEERPRAGADRPQDEHSYAEAYRHDNDLATSPASHEAAATAWPEPVSRQRLSHCAARLVRRVAGRWSPRCLFDGKHPAEKKAQ